MDLRQPCYPPKPPGGALVDQLHRTVSSRQDPKKLQQAQPSWEKISDGLSETGCPGEEPLGSAADLLATKDLREWPTPAE